MKYNYKVEIELSDNNNKWVETHEVPCSESPTSFGSMFASLLILEVGYFLKKIAFSCGWSKNYSYKVLSFQHIGYVN